MPLQTDQVALGDGGGLREAVHLRGGGRCAAEELRPKSSVTRWVGRGVGSSRSRGWAREHDAERW